MSPRDYKNAARPKRDAPARQGSWISFVSGLGVGLVVALGVYLWSDSLPRPGELIGGLGDPAPPPDYAVSDLVPERAPDLPRPRFDFYQILPEMEVPVPEWEIAAGADDDGAGLSPGTYMLQVGSFKRYEDADRAKARLALRGIAARIQRVVINGQDVWFRVHVGPFKEEDELRSMRSRLMENGTDFILLRIGGPDAA